MIETSELLDKVFNGNIDIHSEQDRAFLTENKEEITRHVMTILSEEIPRLLQEEMCLNETILLEALKVAHFLELAETFIWIQKLCHVSTDILDSQFFLEFVTDDLPHLLANTLPVQWDALKREIEDPNLDEFIRQSCMLALVFQVAKGHIERAEVIQYFKELFHRILNGQFNDDDEDFPTNLVFSCMELWPGECLEEIRELFGQELINEDALDLSNVLEDFDRGQDICIDKVKQQIANYHFNEVSPIISENTNPNQRSKQLKEIDRLNSEVDQFLKTKLQRNDLCSCGSGRKYKKCCMLSEDSKIDIVETTISFEPLVEYSPSMQSLPMAERESIFALYDLIQEDPKKLLTTAAIYISKYPDIPVLHNYIYAAYQKLGQPHHAMKVLRETLSRFPNDVFTRTEYALYLLRRGEPDKAHAILGNAETLLQLYPDRTHFHVSEWEAFFYAMALICTDLNDVKQAKKHLLHLQKIAPNSYLTNDIEKKMKRRFFNQAVKKHFPKDTNV